VVELTTGARGLLTLPPGHTDAVSPINLVDLLDDDEIATMTDVFQRY